jgi:transglutaminase-like putative cysteine protease
MSGPAAPTLVDSAQWSMTVTPVVAAVTTLCASTAMAGVIDGMRWLGYAGVAIIVVTATGLGLRAVRTPVLVVGFAQMFAVLCLLVALFTNSGILGIFPGPAAISELGDVLQRSVDVVRTGVPPVDATAPVLCLVVVAIGLVAVLVDTLAVAAGTPAACGLVLLCVYAVPASLADKMLPWWSFVLGASSFAVLLAVDGTHRHQLWRNRPALPGTGGGFGSPATQVGAALVIALIAGSTFTLIGTVGQLPGGKNGSGGTGLGLKPFTSLRGMLDQGTTRELFRVRGLGDQSRYMRAMTLPVYNGNGGWEQRSDLPSGVPAGAGNLPNPPGYPEPGKTTTIEIESIDYKDLYAGVYGTPRHISGLPQAMRYDAKSGMVSNNAQRKLPRFTEEVDLNQPSAQDLVDADADYRSVDPIYLKADGIDNRVKQLANDLTKDKPNPYDKAIALTKYFDGNGFKYDLKTAPGSDATALDDFLFKSKAGFCEQYASAMAILARAAGLPSRVAIGYTGGYQSTNGEYRSITTQDAHAWVEVFFPGQGWVMFDPTPLTDGRTYHPPYATPTAGTQPTDDKKSPTLSPSGTATTSVAPTNDKGDTDPNGGAAGPKAQTAAPVWVKWAAAGAALLALVISILALLAASGLLAGGGFLAARLVRARRVLIGVAVTCWVLATVLAAALFSWWLSVLIVVLTAAAAPGFIRQWQRRNRRDAVHRGLPLAPSAAWAELMAESLDRGAEPQPTETVRSLARRLAREHGLDEDGKRALRTVVSAVERSWYSTRTEPDPTLPAAFDDLVAGLRRTSPLALRARLLPRSVLRLKRRTRPRDD